MTRDLEERVCRFGAWLRRAFGGETMAAPPEACPMHKPIPTPEQHDSVMKATADVVTSAKHLRKVSRLVTEQSDPDNPDSFDQSMRRLLGRIP